MKNNYIYLLLIFLLLIFTLSSCASVDKITAPSPRPIDTATQPTKRDNNPRIITPVASAVAVVSSIDGTATIDSSNANDGYVMIKYSGENPKVKVQIKGPEKPEYIYTIQDYDNYNVYPLSLGSGEYTITVAEHAYDTMYADILQQKITADIRDSFLPFLTPNAYVNFNENTVAVQKGQELAADCYSDIDVITKIFDFVTANIKYDDELAAHVEPGYIPDVDRTLATKKGICFDYASLMTAMLRSQGIPTKLVFGHVGEVYHAWISCYTPETGWMENIIEFDGKEWKLIDPTFYANSDGKRKSSVGDGTNYQQKFIY